MRHASKNKRLSADGRTFATINQRKLEKELVAQAETAYRRLVTDWNVSGKRGAGATPGRASQKALEGQSRAAG